MSELKPGSKLFLLAGLFLATLTAYWNSFHVPFVFDDLQTIQRNSGVRFGELAAGGIRSILFGTREILFKTFALNSRWSGQEVWSYHVVNFAFHFVNGVLLFLIADRLFRSSGTHPERSRIYAAFAAAFFLVHPVQTESVTYISSRSELLSTFFYLAGLLVFVLWPTHRIGFLCSFAVGVFYFLGIGSKETAITLPATIFLVDFLFLSEAQLRPILSRWRFYLVYVVGASAAIYFLLTVMLKHTVGSQLAGNLSSTAYFLTETRVLVRYIRLIFLPIGLNLDYDFRPSSSLIEPAVLASIAFLSTLLVLAWWLRRRQPVFAFSIFWFFITLSPTSSFIPIADVIFEHRLYLPLAGVCLSFPYLIELLLVRLGKRPTPTSSVASVILLVLITGTLARNYVWGDEVRLFTDVVAKSPLKERPYNGLAYAYYKRGDFERAVSTMEEAMATLPNKAANSWDMLATMYLRHGQSDKAIALFQKETQVYKDDRLSLAYNNVGVAYLYMWTDLQAHRNQMSPSDFDARKEQILLPASQAYAKALELEPDYWSSLDSYINVMCWRGKGPELEKRALETLKTEPGGLQKFKAFYTLGKVAFNGEDYARAEAYFEQAEKTRNDVKILSYNEAYSWTMLNQDQRAIEKYLYAIHIDPLFFEAHFNLGLIYMNHKDYDKAVESFTEALRLDPSYVGAHLNLASIYIAEGKRELAREHLSSALRFSPGNPQAISMVQQFGL